MAEDNMIQVEESNLLETIIDESVLPLHMRNDPHLQNVICIGGSDDTYNFSWYSIVRCVLTKILIFARLFFSRK